MTTRARHLLVCVAALFALAVPSIAHASAQKVIRDCAKDGKLDHHYSRKDLKKAKKKLPADLDEYSDCRDVIAAALAGSRKSGPPSGGGPGPTPQPVQAQDQQALKAAQRRKPRVKVGGKTVEPGSNGLFNLSGAANGLPLPLLLALIAVGLMALGGGAYALRRRIPALANLSLPRLPLSRVPFPRRSR